eukprot:TRINITY_DN2784_c0_g1_i1.p1 TRINITY_DN2784_c0_g1~~TRINITY_DN2784_c0_g1_i1.p1  ORF type:complete len:124 (-),score=18.87 TRINITY_DN2784_c0_g1_i1:200-571(-)
MAGSIVILGKRFRLEDYLRAILLISGLVFFTLGDVAAHISFNPTGVLFVLASLVLNSLEVNIQEKLLHQYAVHRNEMTLLSIDYSLHHTSFPFQKNLKTLKQISTNVLQLSPFQSCCLDNAML